MAVVRSSVHFFPYSHSLCSLLLPFPMQCMQVFIYVVAIFNIEVWIGACRKVNSVFENEIARMAKGKINRALSMWCSSWFGHKQWMQYACKPIFMNSSKMVRLPRKNVNSSAGLFEVVCTRKPYPITKMHAMNNQSFVDQKINLDKATCNL